MLNRRKQDKVNFFIRSNAALRQSYDIEKVALAHVYILQQITEVPVSIIHQNECYGYTAELLSFDGPPLTRFKYGNKIAYSINDGCVIFHGHIPEEETSFLATAVSQTDIVLNTCAMYQNIRMLSITDPLTKLFNRRHFMQCLEQELPGPTGLILLDIDKFKTYNDSFGHPAGDRLLERFAQVLKSKVRQTDIVSRCGGEEFAIIIPDCGTKDELYLIAEKVRMAIEQALVPGVAERQVTASFGASLCPQDSIAVDELYKAADGRLYEAKETGRNKVVV